MKTFKEILDVKGLPLIEASKRAGVKYQTFYSHYVGTRKLTAEAAVIYEKTLGIPRYELRPDLWEEPNAQR